MVTIQNKIVSPVPYKGENTDLNSKNFVTITKKGLILVNRSLIKAYCLNQYKYCYFFYYPVPKIRSMRAKQPEINKFTIVFTNFTSEEDIAVAKEKLDIYTPSHGQTFCIFARKFLKFINAIPLVNKKFSLQKDDDIKIFGRCEHSLALKVYLNQERQD